MKDYSKVSLNKFTFTNDSDSQIIRTFIIDGEPWFVANDLFSTLEIKNKRDALRGLDNDEKRTLLVPTFIQNKQMNIVSESGMYFLVFKSSKSVAKKFRKWVTLEVLQQIRKTDNYNAKPHLTKCIQRMLINVNGVNSGYFSVIQEMFQAIHLKLESLGYTIPDSALDGTELRPDVSVGLCFANFLKNYYPTLNTLHKKYTHYFLSGITVEARQYPDELLPLFREFANNVWIPGKAHNYFKDRDPKALDYLPKLLPSKKVST